MNDMLINLGNTYATNTVLHDYNIPTYHHFSILAVFCD